MSAGTQLRKRLEAYRIAEREAHVARRDETSRPGADEGRLEIGEEIEYIPWGRTAEQAEGDCEILAVLGGVEAEYAAIRRGAGVLDAPHRGTLLVTGEDRRDFLDRMLTAGLKDLAEGVARPAFWLNRKGRIESDLLLVEMGDGILVDVDIHQASATTASLETFLFTEAVSIEDVTDRRHRIAVHGRDALAVVAAAGATDRLELAEGRAQRVTIDGATVVAARRDQVGEPGVELFMETDAAGRVWDALLVTDEALAEGRRRIRPLGWYAYNMARIEAGTPLFNIDFGTSSLPHESGVLSGRVSFTKGCYLGQEVVARVENLGRPKQQLVGFVVGGNLLPVAGGHVMSAKEGPMSTPIGVVTSSTLSPMRGATPVGFAMIRTGSVEDGGTVLISAEGDHVEARIGPLRSWPPIDGAKEGPA